MKIISKTLHLNLLIDSMTNVFTAFQIYDNLRQFALRLHDHVVLLSICRADEINRLQLEKTIQSRVGNENIKMNQNWNTKSMNNYFMCRNSKFKQNYESNQKDTTSPTLIIISLELPSLIFFAQESSSFMHNLNLYTTTV